MPSTKTIIIFAVGIVAGAYLYNRTGVLDWLPGLKSA